MCGHFSAVASSVVLGQIVSWMVYSTLKCLNIPNCMDRNRNEHVWQHWQLCSRVAQEWPKREVESTKPQNTCKKFTSVLKLERETARMVKILLSISSRHVDYRKLMLILLIIALMHNFHLKMDLKNKMLLLPQNNWNVFIQKILCGRFPWMCGKLTPATARVIWSKENRLPRPLSLLNFSSERVIVFWVSLSSKA